jgi:Ca-activated chloride channel family protein
MGNTRAEGVFFMGCGTIRQIVVITDGHANVGCAPVDAARAVFAAGVVVSAVGILDGGHLGERGRQEVEAIAAAGGGVASYVSTPELAKTLYDVTWQVTQCTLNVIINEELRKIAGVTWQELPPGKRVGVIDLITDLANVADLQMVILIDTSASMSGKIPAVLQSVGDLILSLQDRKGATKMLVARFPGKETVLQILANNSEFNWNELCPTGRTPTGPAILEAFSTLCGQPTRQSVYRHTSLDVVV